MAQCSQRSTDPQSSLPSAIGIERQLVGSLLHPKGHQFVAEAMQHVGPESFVDPGLAAIFREIVRQFSAGRLIDPALMLDDLKSDLALAGEQVGGLLGELAIEAEPTCAHAPYYAQRLAQVARKRQLALLAHDLKNEACNGKPLDTILADFGADLDNLRRSASAVNPFAGITAAELEAMDVGLEYLVQGTLVHDQPCVIAGPSKAMKTTVSVHLALSLASGEDLFGQLMVYKPCRVFLLSAESGQATIQETQRRIAAAMDVDLAGLPLFYSDRVPRFDDVGEMADLCRWIEGEGVGVCIIDPLYKCLDGEDPWNLSKQGRLLADTTEQILSVGATPIFVHHSVKRLDHEPMEITDVRDSGCVEFMRQWILINRREKYEHNGQHRLWFGCGGSAGHSGLWALDIDEGQTRAAQGRTWAVTRFEPHWEHERRQKDQRRRDRDWEREQRANEDAMAVLDVIALAGPIARRPLRDRLGWGDPRLGRALARLAESESVRESQSGTTTTYEVVPHDRTHRCAEGVR